MAENTLGGERQDGLPVRLNRFVRAYLQRDLVQNEKRQDDNQPYNIANEVTPKNTFPAEHPYSWTIIGDLKDLDSASLDDVKNGSGNIIA